MAGWATRGSAGAGQDGFGRDGTVGGVGDRLVSLDSDAFVAVLAESEGEPTDLRLRRLFIRLPAGLLL